MPKAVIFDVDATPYDAEAGLRTIGLLRCGFPEESLQEADCIAIYQDPADLFARYESSPLAEEGAS